MPTQSTTYNSRVTDEALEKRFRDTFRAQGGAELVDDLYAQGVIVPVVDFTAAATGQQLGTNLQTAWDFATAAYQISNATTTVASTAGFYQVDLTWVGFMQKASVSNRMRLEIFDGSTAKQVWAVSSIVAGSSTTTIGSGSQSFVVFLRSGDILRGVSTATDATLDVWTRQIATVSGDLVDPSGFTSS